MNYNKLVVGNLPRLLLCQELSEAKIQEIINTDTETTQWHIDGTQSISQDKSTVNELLRMCIDDTQFLPEFSSAIKDWCSQKYVASSYILPSQKSHVSNTSNILTNVTNFYRCSNENEHLALFSQNETSVYMTLCTVFNHRINSGTQATAAINKCLQVHSDILQSTTYVPSNMEVDAGFNWWNCDSSTTANYNLRSIDRSSCCEDIPLYFLGLGKTKLKLKSSAHSTDDPEQRRPWPKKDEFNIQTSQTNEMEPDYRSQPIDYRNQPTYHRSQPIDYRNQSADYRNQPTYHRSQPIDYQNQSADYRNQSTGYRNQPTDHLNQSTEIAENKYKTEIWCQTSCCKRPPCTELVSTVSQVKIKPPRVCTIHEKEPCTASKCDVVNYQPDDDDKAPVIVTTGANPRRGVFEIVIRRLNGAPLAKNELILEWTPPLSRPCGAPCPLPWCFPNTCRPTKCKMIVCRTPSCKPSKCCRKICKRPCGPMPRPCSPRPCGPRPCGPRPCGPRPCGPRPCGPLACGPLPCGPLPCGVNCPRKCYRPPCRPSPPLSCLPRPCPSRPCPSRPCPPRPCRLPRSCLSPGSSPCCKYPCPSTPCFRTCPVGKYRKWKKNHKPKIKRHRKHISPCLNRAECCPVVSCRSMPPGCGTCASCLPCPAGKCCSPCKSVKFPFKPRCCRSECANCC